MQLFLSAIAALALLNYGGTINGLLDLPGIRDVCTTGTHQGTCVGVSAVLRISLGCTMYFAVMLPTALSESSFQGWWAIKLLVWAGSMIGCFFLPSDTMNQYGQAARGFSGVFLVVLALLSIDFAYNVQDWFTSKMEAAEADLGSDYEVGLCQNKWRFFYLLFAFVCISLSLAGIIAMFVYSTTRPDGIVCGTNTGFLSFTLVAGLVVTVLSPFEIFGSRGLLPPTVLWAYCTWLTWSALYANPDSKCNPVPPQATSTAATIVGMVIAALSLCYTAFAASRSVPGLFKSPPAVESPDGRSGSQDSSDDDHKHSHQGAPKAGADSHLLDAEHGGSAASYARSPSKTPTAGAAKPEPHSVVSSVIFLFTLALASLYSAMVLSNWAVDATSIVTTISSDSSMWAQFGSEITVVVLYAWTLVAPLVCRGRDFS